MAATDPRQPERDNEQYGRPTLVQRPATSPRHTARWIVLGLVAVAVLALIVYMLAYNDGSGGGTGGGTGGYLVVAFSMDRLRRMIGRDH
jgi:hypothetical protein